MAWEAAAVKVKVETERIFFDNLCVGCSGCVNGYKTVGLMFTDETSLYASTIMPLSCT